jgi:hypothetical protein
MLKTAKKKDQRTLIRSDFKKQGIWLLSAYLNSLGIKHYYIHKKLCEADRTRILNEYNDVYQPIAVDGQRGVLLEYIGSSGLDMQREYEVEVTTKSGKLKRKKAKGESIKYLPVIKQSERLVMLLDNESSEGISLMGVENVQLLEPLLNIAQRDQVEARAIRFQSHRHLPKHRHTVTVYTHMGVVKPTSYGKDMVSAAIHEQVFTMQRESHLNKYFSGIVPRTGNMFFDMYWNKIEVLHPGFDGTNCTPDSKVYKKLVNEDKHHGQYTDQIKKTNVLSSSFQLPGDCHQKEGIQIKQDNYAPAN